ncbi:unnamed protein product [Prorocentrum cordatum]|uniref:Uncharacterized protein n=1 Tax=Prorocentrum cordatum TaxID=2364126 RepID=A0ABN9SAF4_9DINO|nr:unnamed protein product [Polarella glacialis]
MGDLAECMKRLAEVEIPLQAQKRLADACGSLAQAPAVTRWLQAVLREDGMVDTFAELHPRAEERFTCWDQYKNRRYENIGARIRELERPQSRFSHNFIMVWAGPRSASNQERMLSVMAEVFKQADPTTRAGEVRKVRVALDSTGA